MLVLFGSCHHQTVNRNVQDIRYRQHYVSRQRQHAATTQQITNLKKTTQQKIKIWNQNANHACKTRCDWLEKNAKWIWVNVPVMIWGFGYVLAPMDGDIYYVRCWLYCKPVSWFGWIAPHDQTTAYQNLYSGCSRPTFEKVQFSLGWVFFPRSPTYRYLTHPLLWNKSWFLFIFL